MKSFECNGEDMADLVCAMREFRHVTKAAASSYFRNVCDRLGPKAMSNGDMLGLQGPGYLIGRTKVRGLRECSCRGSREKWNLLLESLDPLSFFYSGSQKELYWKVYQKLVRQIEGMAGTLGLNSAYSQEELARVGKLLQSLIDLPAANANDRQCWFHRVHLDPDDHVAAFAAKFGVSCVICGVLQLRRLGIDPIRPVRGSSLPDCEYGLTGKRARLGSNKDRNCAIVIVCPSCEERFSSSSVLNTAVKVVADLSVRQQQ